MKNPTEIACTVRQIRDRSIAVADGTTETVSNCGVESEREKWFFLPLSQIRVEALDFKVDQSVIVTMPEWLALEKGLI